MELANSTDREGVSTDTFKKGNFSQNPITNYNNLQSKLYQCSHLICKSYKQKHNEQFSYTHFILILIH